MDYTIVLLLLSSVHATIQTCTINEVELSSKYNRDPLIIDAKTLQFVYPLDKQNGEIITVTEDTEILISCGPNSLSSHINLSIDGKTIRAKCNSESQFVANGTVLKVEEVLCFSDFMEVATDTNQKCANNKGILVDVSYPIEAVNVKVLLYEVCLDLNAKTVFYSKFISPELANTGNGFSIRITFPKEDAEIYFNITSNALEQTVYNRFATKALVNQLVGLPADSDKYFPSNFTGKPNAIDIHISLELLSDNVFFFYKNQQQATSRYINSIPIWDVYHYSYLNNWDNMRFGLRQFAINNRYELEIYTGTYGVATLPHEDSNKDVELYLAGDGSKTFPLPKLLWRLVYNRKAKSAIVLVTVNNPWILKEDDIVCSDIGGESGWDRELLWPKSKIDNMYSYACKYEDFKKTVTFVPDLVVESVLNSSHNQRISLLILSICTVFWKFL